MATDVVSMLNQIAANIAIGEPLDVGAEKTADHVNRFWTTAMIKEVCNHANGGGELSAAASAAIPILRNKRGIQG